MTQNLKALVVILALSGVVFMLARPLCLRYMSGETYARRRNIWLVLTIVAFASPSFWLYALVTIVLLGWLARQDENPVAAALLLYHVVPPIQIDLPSIVVNRLFELNNFRLVAIALLLPAAFKLLQPAHRLPGRPFLSSDLFVISFAALQLLLLMPYESLTNTMRRGFLYGLDVLLVYFVFSRSCTRPRVIADALASFVLACALMSVVAVFEWQKGWLLFTSMGEVWGDPNQFAWLLRGESLRAQVSAGHSLTLGYLLAVGFAFWLGVQQRAASRTQAVAVAIWLWAGLIAAMGRSPWMVAAVAYVAYNLVAPVKLASVVGRLLVITLAAAIVLASPYGPSIIERLPFVGSIDAETVDYRQRLATMSWELVKQNPLLGSPFVLSQLESLRQGQGIIDLVNTYASIAMFYGIVGLVLFLGSFLIGLGRVTFHARRLDDSKRDLAFLGAALSAAMVGTLAMLAAGSFGNGLALLYWVLTGMAAGYAAMCTRAPRLYRAIETSGYRPATRSV